MIALILACALLFSMSACFAETNFDPSAYSDEELRDILSKINLYFSESSVREGDVLYDANGVYVEFRGVVQPLSRGYVLKIFVRNETDDEVSLYLDKALVDRATLTKSNSSAYIEPNSLFISTTRSNYFILYTDVLADYGIDHGKYLESTFSISSDSFKDTFDLNIPVDFTP